MIVEAIAAAVLALGSPVAWFTVARPALHAHRYARCLANIERLEIELGYRPAPPRVYTAVSVAARWQQGVSSGAQTWVERQERDYDRRMAKVKREQNAWKVKHASGREP